MTGIESNDNPGVWHLNAAGLHMCFDATEEGKLVLLADVVRWLMSGTGKALPRSEAVNALCTALEQARPEPDLFRASRDKRATLLQGDTALFGYHTEKSFAKLKFMQAWREK